MVGRKQRLHFILKYGRGDPAHVLKDSVLLKIVLSAYCIQILQVKLLLLADLVGFGIDSRTRRLGHGW